MLVGLEKVSLLVDPDYFHGLIYGSSLWKDMGWGTIIYLAAIAGINPALYEAASIDGANRFQQMLHITWPSLKSTVVILLILQIGRTMSSGGGGSTKFSTCTTLRFTKSRTFSTRTFTGALSLSAPATEPRPRSACSSR
ncbi:ABC transporter permease subunit [Paenibacillus sp. P26]|nr:ABC transporter permease subunit [Paenibacillus sp. P26]